MLLENRLLLGNVLLLEVRLPRLLILSNVLLLKICRWLLLNEIHGSVRLVALLLLELILVLNRLLLLLLLLLELVLVLDRWLNIVVVLVRK